MVGGTILSILQVVDTQDAFDETPVFRVEMFQMTLKSYQVSLAQLPVIVAQTSKYKGAPG
jgi:hypothetical protein